MQVLLHSDMNTDGYAPLAAHLNTVINEALARYGQHVTGVDAHLSDLERQTRAGSDDVHCALEAQIAGEQAIIVQDYGSSAHLAIAGALRKLRRAVAAAIAKQDPRHPRARAVQPSEIGPASP